MKKALIFLSSVVAWTASAQPQGRFEHYRLEGFDLHVYYTNDVMNDASYVIEGPEALVTLEHPLFKTNVAEFDAFVAGLGKEVATRIADYHVGGTGDAPYLMAEGMPKVVGGPLYGGMMAHFAEVFGDAIVGLPTGEVSEAAFDTTQELAGVPFRFMHGVATDFPAASLLIGGQVYYTHWTPARTHVSHLQVGSAAALDAEIAETEKSLSSGASLFIGGHGGAVGADDVRFRIAYLQRLRQLSEENDSPEKFVVAVLEAYPGLPGEEGLPELAAALYGAR